jgi:hypothetical protein
MLWVFSPEKSDGFRRVQNRNLVYKGPALIKGAGSVVDTGLNSAA